MNIAQAVSLRSDCIRRQVGALVVRDRRIISTGYNGTPRGTKNCGDGGCPRCSSRIHSGEFLAECLCSHAEENAIVQAAFHGISLKDSTLYATISPCLTCAKMIINAGIKTVYYGGNYATHHDKVIKLLDEAGVANASIKDDVGVPLTKKEI